MFGRKTEKKLEETAISGNRENWERDVITRLAFSAITEQRRSRLWNNLFKGFLVVYLLVLMVISFSGQVGKISSANEPHTALIEINGAISASSAANAEDIITALTDAFENKQAKGILLKINSPGGSPVQAGYIYDEIIRLRNIHPDKKVYAVVSDLCASGGYYIAAAADSIYANRASLVGSIGAKMGSFGFTDTMSLLGVERRVVASGERKTFMDPFSPENPQDVEHAKKLVNEVHQQFIDAVKLSRGNRLTGSDETLFSGLLWTGTQSLELGLIDGLASPQKVIKDVIKQTDVVNYTLQGGVLDQLLGKLGISVGYNSPMF